MQKFCVNMVTLKYTVTEISHNDFIKCDLKNRNYSALADSTYRKATFGPEGSDSPEFVLIDAGWQNKQGWICLTHLIIVVDLTDKPALIGQTLHVANKHTGSCNDTLF